MKRHGIVAGEPDHTGLGWLSRQLQRLFNKPAPCNLAAGGERVALAVDALAMDLPNEDAPTPMNRVSKPVERSSQPRP